jgi:Leucine-rich repeat (LRR) protein
MLNPMRNLPDYFREFSSLEYLNLESNNFEELPECIGQFRKHTPLNIGAMGLKN